MVVLGEDDREEKEEEEEGRRVRRRNGEMRRGELAMARLTASVGGGEDGGSAGWPDPSMGPDQPSRMQTLPLPPVDLSPPLSPRSYLGI